MVLNDLCHRDVQCAAWASQARCPVLRYSGLQKGVGHAVAAWGCTWGQGRREWRLTWQWGLRQPGRGGCGSPSPSSATRKGWHPFYTSCTGKGGPSLPEWLQGSLHCHFLSQDDVNVTFLQHLSLCMSVNIKPSKEWPSSFSSPFSSSSLLSFPESTAPVVHWAHVLVAPYPLGEPGARMGVYKMILMEDWVVFP